MKVKFKCIPMDPDWLGRCRKRGWTVGTEIPMTDCRANGNDYPPSKYNELKQRLLAVAGQAVCLHREEDLPSLLSIGMFVRGYHARMMRGKPSRCHSNSAALWDKNRDRLTLMTGYALSQDGMWRQHSWCVIWNESIEDWQVIETTEKRLLYYGFQFDDKEADDFLFQNF